MKEAANELVQKSQDAGGSFLNTDVPHDPAVPQSAARPAETKADVHAKTGTRMFFAVLVVTRAKNGP